VSEIDGHEPHLIAPEQGYRRLIESSLYFFRGLAEAVVDVVLFSATVSRLLSHCYSLLYHDSDLGKLKDLRLTLIKTRRKQRERKR